MPHELKKGMKKQVTSQITRYKKAKRITDEACLVCADCGEEVPTAGPANANRPVRCEDCRRVRKSELQKANRKTKRLTA
jgi:DNA-directed RNA polymerase subunit RPC12/RpoP